MMIPGTIDAKGPALSQEKTAERQRQRPGAGGQAPPGRPRLILPGLPPADPRLERYRVHPGAVTAVELGAGDEIAIIDAEGRQRGELTVLARGGEGFGELGTSADGAATVLRAMAAPGPSGGGVTADPEAGRTPGALAAAE